MVGPVSEVTVQGYEALRAEAAWMDLSARGKILVRGQDRARLLHALTTNHVQQLEPGAGCYAFFLNAQGRILGDVHILCGREAFLLDTEPETRQPLYQHVDRYIIADDVTLEDATEGLMTLALEGPLVANALRSIGAPLPEAPYSFCEWDARMVCRLTYTGAPGFWIVGPVDEKPALLERIRAAGVVPADEEAARAVRLEQGKPRYGEDFSAANLAQETQLTHALHFNKGCYLGQEIVERIRSRGHVNRLLVRLTIEAAEAPPRGSKILREGAEVGEITSAAYSPAFGKVLAFGYLRAEHIHTGADLTVCGSPASLTSPSGGLEKGQAGRPLP